ncbi:MAG: thioesterase family protein [Succiniclasticum sp.]|jgi:fluoroacetyl-CoA thioesterase
MINLHDYLNVGQNAIVQRVVKASDATTQFSSPFKDLLATPTLLLWAIDASVDAVDSYLPEGYASIGLSINFVHTAPTSVGMTVTTHVSIIDITEHDVLLSIKAWDEQGEIGHGTLKRAIVEKDSILNKAKERSKMISSRRILNLAKQ